MIFDTGVFRYVVGFSVYGTIYSPVDADLLPFENLSSSGSTLDGCWTLVWQIIRPKQSILRAVIQRSLLFAPKSRSALPCILLRARSSSLTEVVILWIPSSILVSEDSGSHSSRSLRLDNSANSRTFAPPLPSVLFGKYTNPLHLCYDEPVSFSLPTK